MVKSRDVQLIVRVTHVYNAPDSEIRISRAIDLILASAPLNENSQESTAEKKDRGKTSSGSECEEDQTDAGE